MTSGWHHPQIYYWFLNNSFLPIHFVQCIGFVHVFLLHSIIDLHQWGVPNFCRKLLAERKRNRIFSSWLFYLIYTQETEYQIIFHKYVFVYDRTTWLWRCSFLDLAVFALTLYTISRHNFGTLANFNLHQSYNKQLP